MASVVELFHAEQDRYLVEIEWVSSPAVELGSGRPQPDLVYGRWLTAPGVIERFRPVDRLFRNETISADLFYPDLLALGRRDERQVVLPFTFDLPAIAFRESGPADTNGAFATSLDELRDPAVGFAQRVNGSLTNLAYSPLWTPESIYLSAVLAGVRFSVSNDRLEVDLTGLARTITAARGWIDTVAGSVEDDAVFTERYLHEPLYQLVLTRRVLMYLTSAAGYYRVPTDKRAELDLRWIGANGAILVDDGFRGFAVPQQGRNREAALWFLGWVFDPGTQRHIIEQSQFKRLSWFGFAGGFSALERVNQRDLPEFFPEMIGRIPPSNDMRFVRPPVADWDAMREAVIDPWLADLVLERADADDLDSRFVAWRREQEARFIGVE